MWSYRAARVVHVANSLDIFTILAGRALSADELAQACSARPDLLKKLLIACCALGLLEKQQQKYRNTDFADTYLVAGRQLYQGDIIAHSGVMWDFWSSLENEVRLEGTLPVDEAARHRHFIMGMHNIALLGRAEKIAAAVDLTGRKKLFDVGGGSGTYSLVFCRHNPDLHAVVFDVPDTIALARQVIAQENMSDRVSVREGSWDVDDFGSDNDVVMLSNVLHGPQSQAGMKLTKAYHSMPSGAQLLVQEFLLNNDKTGPLIPALFNIMVGAYSRAELCSEIEKAGFGQIRVILELKEQAATLISALKP